MIPAGLEKLKSIACIAEINYLRTRNGYTPEIVLASTISYLMLTLNKDLNA